MRRLILALALTLVACEPELTPLVDAGRSTAHDAGLQDGGALDVDGGSADAGSSDAGSDAGLTDAGSPDAGTPGDAGTPDAGAARDAGTSTDGGSACRVIFCFNGAPSRTASSNFPFNHLCDSLVNDGLVQDCGNGGSGTTCHSTFDSFLVNAASTLYPRVFSALDTNRDQRVDARDQACLVVFLGYSWGGVASVEVATALLADTRIDTARRAVDLIVAIDPYQPSRTTLDVPSGVRAFHEFRHSVSPPNDCSATALLGPYRGLPPRCRASSTCADYDYSLAPMRSFSRYTSGAYLGSQIGHCEVPEVMHPQARALVRGQPVTGTPPQRTVPIIP